MDIKDIHSVADIILIGSAEKPDEEMIIYGDERITWQQMKDRSSQVANALRADGVGPGDRVPLGRRYLRCEPSGRRPRH